MCPHKYGFHSLSQHLERRGEEGENSKIHILKTTIALKEKHNMNVGNSQDKKLGNYLKNNELDDALDKVKS